MTLKAKTTHTFCVTNEHKIAQLPNTSLCITHSEESKDLMHSSNETNFSISGNSACK